MFDVLDGLPPGRFLPAGSATIWHSGAPVTEPVRWWELCQRDATATSVWPVLQYGGPIRPWPARDPAEIAAIDVGAALEVSWRSLRELQARGPDFPAGWPTDVLADLTAQWPDQWPPYRDWPGLAPAVPDSGTANADEVHRLALERVVRTSGLPSYPEPYLILVSAERPADIPAVMAWDRDAPVVQFSAMLRSWEDRFGARLVAFEGARAFVSVARPPRTAAHASHVALELMLTSDNHNEGHPFANLASSLVGQHLWSFWWD